MVELNHALSVRGESSAGTRLIRKTEREINNLINSALPVLAYPVNSIRQCALFCRKGATYLSPGLRRSYPGSAGATQPTLKGLRHCFPRPPYRWQGAKSSKPIDPSDRPRQPRRGRRGSRSTPHPASSASSKRRSRSNQGSRSPLAFIFGIQTRPSLATYSPTCRPWAGRLASGISIHIPPPFRRDGRRSPTVRTRRAVPNPANVGYGHRKNRHSLGRVPCDFDPKMQAMRHDTHLPTRNFSINTEFYPSDSWGFPFYHFNSWRVAGKAFLYRNGKQCGF